MLSDWRRAKTREISHLPEQEIHRIEDALSVFNSEANLTYSGGSFSLPSDFDYIPDDGGVYLDDIIPIEIVSPSEYKSIIRSKSVEVNEYTPIGYISASSLTVYPSTVGNTTSVAYPEVTISYSRVPNDPVISISEISGIEVIDPASVIDFDLPEYCFNDLVIEILEPLGVHLRDEFVEQYAASGDSKNFQKDNA